MNSEPEQKQPAPPERATAAAPAEYAPERDRRGVPLPPRPRVGGIITPQ